MQPTGPHQLSTRIRSPAECEQVLPTGHGSSGMGRCQVAMQEFPSGGASGRRQQFLRLERCAVILGIQRSVDPTATKFISSSPR